MRPRTKLQKEVIGISAALRNRNSEIREWAAQYCLEHRGYATKSRVVCMDCGGRFPATLISKKQALCPHCGTKIKIEYSRKRTDRQQTYVAVAEIYGDFQIIRNFEIYSHHKDGAAARYDSREILQHFILPSGKYETVARNHTTNWYCDSWGGDMEIRKNYSSYYYHADRYDVYPSKYHPGSEFKPMYRKYGIDHHLQGLTFVEAIKTLPVEPIVETLLKTKQYSLLSVWGSKSRDIRRYWPSIKICHRRRYKIKDATMWFDYLDLLVYFGKDIHNSKYICPANLKKEHDRLMFKKREIQRQRDLERKKKKAIKDEAKFKKLKSKFFGIEFTDGEIRVHVIDNVLDFVAEGDTLHHCVYTGDYHLRPDSLILSARIKDEPVETVEISLKTMEVVQCRGKFNKNSEYHDRILNLVKKNIHLIRKKTTA